MMPFVSQREARWMFANKPALAKEFAAKTASIKALPEKVGSERKRKRPAIPKSP